MNKNEPNCLLEMGIRYMKGYGVKIDFTLAFECFAKSFLDGNPIGHIYYAIVAKMTKIPHYEQIYKYNFYKAKLYGLSLAYVEEAKCELGLYKNIPKGSTQVAEQLLQIAIDAGDEYAMYIKGRYFHDDNLIDLLISRGYGKAIYFRAQKDLEMGLIDKAIPQLEAATNYNLYKACYYLGVMYLIRGKINEAHTMLFKATFLGISSMIVRYGLELLPGTGKLPSNANEAFKYFQWAHNLNNIDGTFHLAECYRNGIGCNKNLDQAIRLYEIGCSREIKHFFEPCAQCYGQLKGMKNWMKMKKYESIAKKIEANKYKKQEISSGPIYHIDSGSPYNPNKAFQNAMEYKMKDLKKYCSSLETAFNLGLFSAIKETILHLLSGLYITQNIPLAHRLLYQLMDMKWGTAYKLMGDISAAGHGVPWSYKKAYHYYKKAAIYGSKSGMYKLGIALVQGIGCSIDLDRGYKYIDKSGCKYAHHYLMYYTNYQPQIAKSTINCLDSNISIAQSYGGHALSDVLLAAKKDLRYGIIFYHQYSWRNERSQLSSMSMIGLRRVADSGSSNAMYQYGFAHYAMKHNIKAIKYLVGPAEEDNWSACHYLGKIFITEGTRNPELAKKYLSLSAINTKNVEDMWDLATKLTSGNECVKWLEMAAEYDSSKRWDVAITLGKGVELREVKPSPELAKKWFLRCDDLDYEKYYSLGSFFYHGDLVNQDKKLAREFYKKAADKGRRPNEKATKNYIEMCRAGEGGSEFTPWEYVKQVADSNDPDHDYYSFMYGAYCFEKGEFYFQDAIHYFERSGTEDGIENAKKLRNYLAEKRRAEEARRRAQEAANKKDDGLIGAALLVGGLCLLVGAPPVF
ncbi:hypothetical protein TRFO_31866 [Tritrichomonas foetus]|uniref:HCP-like protein n=1 Tax=Tritrichomonas foetus TaxID=1144522 RepID=A0A1J4JQK6_9EUKA|nr:hypothetical protein TRFO_31866 [Tritrichomonas foetus]|eukprot:OHT01323.1 hypothetical protein TRFO_31866 [Tritrichomonas foetus]